MLSARGKPAPKLQSAAPMPPPHRCRLKASCFLLVSFKDVMLFCFADSRLAQILTN